MRRLTAALVLVVVAVLGAPPSASADTTLTGSDPADGAEVAAAPERISLTFSAPVEPDLVVIFVTGADGVTWPVGEITANGNTLTMPVTAAGPAGRCTVRYSIASEDDPVSGQLSFTMTTAAPSRAPTSAAAEPDPVADAERAKDEGVPLWVWLAVGAAVAGVAVGVLFGRTRGSGRSR